MVENWQTRKLQGVSIILLLGGNDGGYRKSKENFERGAKGAAAP